jgi:hypothetical protein
MSMHEVNLVPPSIADRVARGRASRRVMLASACIGTVALGIALTAVSYTHLTLPTSP